MHVVRIEEVDLCRQLQADGASDLASHLIQEGYLSEYLARKVARRLLHVDLYCPSCRDRFSLKAEELQGLEVYTCSHCNHKMRRGDYWQKWLPDLVIDRPQYLLDKNLRKMVRKMDLVSSKDLDRGLKIQESRRPRRDLARILVDQNLLSLNKIKKLLKALRVSLAERYPHLERMKRDVKMARFLARSELVPINRINACLADQVRNEKKSDEWTDLESILVDRGYLMEYQLTVAFPESFVEFVRLVGTDGEQVESEKEPADVRETVTGMEEEAPESSLPKDQPIEIDNEEPLDPAEDISDLFDDSDDDNFLDQSKEESFLEESDDELLVTDAVEEDEVAPAAFSQMVTEIDEADDEDGDEPDESITVAIEDQEEDPEPEKSTTSLRRSGRRGRSVRSRRTSSLRRGSVESRRRRAAGSEDSEDGKREDRGVREKRRGRRRRR